MESKGLHQMGVLPQKSPVKTRACAEKMLRAIVLGGGKST
jgi:hypothetical protein